ncbi:Co-chaperone Hsc20 [Choiromyces venosus 120613-1]|uniref:Co-chaperone Hsc20 n=1 Tax=Choiromyces venosus 120613-1 TaxID=1336337 RepID=A0A3N4JVE9_9PEZI|nr:Co-chaperone Hsc20 [Choiromyces venosus 120613-1]
MILTETITRRLLPPPLRLLRRTYTAKPPPPHFYTLFPHSLPSGPPPSGLFNLPPTILKSLHREFLKSQQSVHPDLTQDPSLKRAAQNTSAYLNTAYKTLRDPLLRAHYLLRMRGVEVEDEAGSVEDMVLLGEVMEAMEEVDEIGDEGEGRGSGRWERAWEVNEGRIGEEVKALEDAFARDELEKARIGCVRLRYWRNVKRRLEDVLEGRGRGVGKG